MALAEQRVDRYNSLGHVPRRNETYQWRDVNYKNRLLSYGSTNDFDFLKNMAKIIKLDKQLELEPAED
jgi:hypothetical protein